jgi:tRNA1(Val) A37 N6-methylase TrmN6
MILHGDGSSAIIKNDGIVNFQAYKHIKGSILADYKKSDTTIYGKDQGEFLVTENFDAVLTNPPFSVTPVEDANERVKHFLF